MRRTLALAPLFLGACLPAPPDWDPDSSAGALALDPSDVWDFDEVEVGCERHEKVTVTNVGGGATSVGDAWLEGAVSGLRFEPAYDDGELPFGLTPGESRTLGTVRWEALIDGPERTLGTLVVASDAPKAEEQTLAFQGSIGGEFVVESFVAGHHPMDIVFTVDRSGSTMDEVSYIVGKLDGFLGYLDTQGISFRIMGTTLTDGCVLTTEKWIDESFEPVAAAALFDAMLDAQPATSDASLGLLRADNALSADAQELGGCNEGFRRDDAMLHIIGVSDGPDTSPDDPESYLRTQQGAMKEPYEVVYHAIGADVDCGDAQAYDNFDEVVDASGGHFLSVCQSDWWQHLTGLATAMVNRADRSTYLLSEHPFEPSLAVYHTDALMSRDSWDYLADSNAVVIDEGALPNTGDRLRIEYYPEPACD